MPVVQMYLNIGVSENHRRNWSNYQSQVTSTHLSFLSSSGDSDTSYLRSTATGPRISCKRNNLQPKHLTQKYQLLRSLIGGSYLNELHVFVFVFVSPKHYVCQSQDLFLVAVSETVLEGGCRRVSKFNFLYRMYYKQFRPFW